MNHSPVTLRPGVVTAASMILYITSAIGIIATLIIIGEASGLPVENWVFVVLWLQIAICVLDIVLATKIRQGSRGARTGIIALCSLDIVLTLISGPQAIDILGIGTALLVIGLLAWNRDAQEFFSERY